MSDIRKRKGVLGELLQNKAAYLLALPAAVYTVIFGYLTMPYLLIAFQKFNYKTGLFNSPWIGFDNFRFFFASPRAWEITFNTLKLNTLFIVFGTIAALLLAILFNELKSRLFSRIAQSTILFPHFLSWVIVSYVLYSLLSTEYGMVNRILEAIGMEPINWYSSPGYWTSILVGTHIWKDIGISLVIYLAAIAGIDESYYEAGRIDGATRMQLIRYITLPLLLPTVIILSLLALGKIMYGGFDMIYAIVKDNGLLYPTTEVIDTYVFRSLRNIGNPAQAMAIGLYQAVVGFILVYTSNKVVRKINPDHALF
ncbi:putative aldouronate transport system permease protein [Cohnella sp. SGD-V74]|uniref:ABC transporter permease n=1 Tax=unclassified Cohnella TaxID=2636738 RepID=UPI000D4F6457|nr:MULTISPECIES: ABC transporter permease subunit [unclassified Cohnella]PRX61941.1 putative aldouronate transport system permease protein [Cohnella sp. SGD-V74]